MIQHRLQPDQTILDQVYEAAAVPELWPQTLARLCEIASAWGAGLLVFDPAQNMRFISTDTYEEVFTSFVARGAGYDNTRPKRALASGHVGFLHDLELYSQAELDTDPVYRDFIYPAGIRWTAGTIVPVPTSDIIAFDFSRRTEPFIRGDMERLDLYRPHLARAALLAHRLQLTAARNAVDALEVVGLPAAVIGTDRRVAAANESLVALAPRVRIGAMDRVYFQSTGADALLAEALENVHAQGVRSVPLAATETMPAIVAHLIPIKRTAHDIFSRGEVLALFTLVTAPTAPLTEVLTGLFDLTPAEARVARGIAVGRTVEELAGANGVSRETVRTQLKSLMLKTGTKRQTDLVILLSGIRPA